ncbi:MAG: NAD(P)-dependent glycerol-3-phosphate dehydrogenase [Parachlamydiaceae bacterium]|nr:NAD(P)-dependent glycerol-3-phosphate dehydrogenase [Parachlamydiaceae bacterium]
MKIAILGSGSWGYCLASLLATKGYKTISWTTKQALANELSATRTHPSLPTHRSSGDMTFTTNLAEALDGIDLLVESVTSAGLRPVFEKVKKIGIPLCSIVVSSKGIEQNTGLILPNVIVETLGEEVRNQVGLLTGPSFAEEVIRGLPTSVVGSAFAKDTMHFICDAFTTQSFRVYPNADIYGACYGSALKNVIAIACGISEGLKLGSSSKAALMTRGLHEVRKLSIALGCDPSTLNGLSGMGDFVLTCNSPISRNFRYGMLLAQGLNPDEAEKKIEMVVEGRYTCISALQLSKKLQVPMPITETVGDIVSGKIKPLDAVYALMQRTVKEESL